MVDNEEAPLKEDTAKGMASLQQERVGESPSKKPRKTAAPIEALNELERVLNDRLGKHDTWAKENIDAKQLCLLMDKGVGDVPKTWEEHFRKARVRATCAGPLHVLRCLDPTQVAYEENLILVPDIGLNTETALCFRRGAWLKSWHLDHYAEYLNWISRSQSPGGHRFFCFGPLDLTGVGPKILKGKVYNSKAAGFRDKLDFQQILDRFKVVALPLNPSQTHWSFAMLWLENKRAKRTRQSKRTCRIRYYCSMGITVHARKAVLAWVKPQLDDTYIVDEGTDTATVPQQVDSWSCGERTMLNIQYCMFQGSALTQIEYTTPGQVEYFRYIMLQRIMDHQEK
jgi:hypothetical protein